MTRRAVLAATLLLTLIWAPAEALQNKGAKPAKPNRPFEIGELEKKVFHISFPANEKASIRIKSSEETDVDLYVQEMNGLEVHSDIADSKDCLVEFTPLKNKTYRISVINLGQGGNSCTLTHTGKEEKIDFGKLTTTKPIKIAEAGKQNISTKVEKDKWAAVWVTSEQITEVHAKVYDPDGKEIAKDDHLCKDAFVSFLPKVSGTYRIEIHNLGQGENTCTVKYTTTEETKKDALKKEERRER